jgi:GxxExxY protein
MDTNEHRYDGPHAQLTFSIIGSAMEVLKHLGHGLPENPGENALVVESGLRGIGTDQQRRLNVDYKGTTVGEFIPDLIVGQAVIVDAKVIDRITDLEQGQVMNCLRITGLKVGLMLNFKRSKLEWERIIR